MGQCLEPGIDSCKHHRSYQQHYRPLPKTTGNLPSTFETVSTTFRAQRPHQLRRDNRRQGDRCSLSYCSCYRYLSHYQRTAYNSCDPNDPELAPYMSRTRGKTITTRQRVITGILLEILEFSVVESRELLLKHSPRSAVIIAEEGMVTIWKITNTADATFDSIIKALDKFSLAINHARVYSIQEDLSFETYYEQLLDNKPCVLSKKTLTFGIDSAYCDSVFTPWETSFAALQKHHPRAAHLLNLYSLLDKDDLSIMLFQRGLSLAGKAPKETITGSGQILIIAIVEDRNDCNTLPLYCMIKRYKVKNNFRTHISQALRMIA